MEACTRSRTTAGPPPQAYLRELLVIRVPEKKVQESLGQHHGGAEGLRPRGYLAWRGASPAGGGSFGAGGRPQVCSGEAQPLGGVVQEAWGGAAASAGGSALDSQARSYC